MKLTKINTVLVGCMISLSGMLSSCASRAERYQKKLIAEASELIRSVPDSALSMLNSVDTERLSQRDHARFQVLKIRAKDRAYLNITADTAVFQARDYLVKTRDKYAVMACCVSARVFSEQGNMDKALYDYLMAAELGQNSDDYYIMGIIYYNLSKIYYDHQFYTESLFYSRKAARCDELVGARGDDKAWTLELTGDAFLYLSRLDSSIIYLNRALSMAGPGDENKRRIYHTMAEAYYRNKEYDLARKKCRESWVLTDPGDSLSKGRLNLIRAGIDYDNGQKDSSYHYALLAKSVLEDSDRNFDLVDLYRLLYNLESEIHGVREAYYKRLYDIYAKFQGHANRSILREQQRHQDYSILALKKEKEWLKQQNFFYLIILGLLSLAVIGVYFFHRYWKRSKQKQEELQRLYLDEMASLSRMVEDKKMQIIFHVKDLAELKQTAFGKDAEKNIRRELTDMLERLSWDVLYPTLNDIHHGLLDRIRDDFPTLTDIEYKSFCLNYAGFGGISISAILGESLGTAQSRLTEVRKKVGIESRGAIKEFLDTWYGISADTTPDKTPTE